MWLRTVGCIVTLALGMLVAPPAIEAQPPGKVPRVGVLRHTRLADESWAGRLEEFRQGLRDHGYIEGQNIFLEMRYSEGRLIASLSWQRSSSASKWMCLWSMGDRTSGPPGKPPAPLPL
jgi:hypothetical protein